LEKMLFVVPVVGVLEEGEVGRRGWKDGGA